MSSPFSRPVYVLVTHGSPDPRPGQALTALTNAMADRLRSQSPDVSPMVRGAELECREESLAEQILAIHGNSQRKKRDGIVIIPLFLSAGVHAMEDIPAAIAEAQSKLATLAQATGVPSLPIETAPVLGKHAAWPTWIQHHWRTQLQPGQTPVVIAHGTRRIGGNQKIEALARSLEARLAFWAIAPKVTDTVEALVAQGHTQLNLLPYFLFSGGITDAIAQQLQSLQNHLDSHCPDVTITLSCPFGQGQLHQEQTLADFLVTAYVKPEPLRSAQLADLVFPQQLSPRTTETV